MNLTPTQKADELIEKFRPFAYSNPKHDTSLFEFILTKNAIHCAIIAVDEMIIEFKKSDSLFATNFLAGYWQEVKTILTDRL